MITLVTLVQRLTTTRHYSNKLTILNTVAPAKLAKEIQKVSKELNVNKYFF